MKFPIKSNITNLAKFLFDCFSFLYMNLLCCPNTAEKLLNKSQWILLNNQTHKQKASCTKANMGQPSILSDSILLAMTLDECKAQIHDDMAICIQAIIIRVKEYEIFIHLPNIISHIIPLAYYILEFL